MPGLGGTQRLAKIAGKVRANQYILSGQNFDAVRAKEMNIIAEVVPKDKLRETVLKYAADVAKYSIYSLIVAKRTVNKAEDLGITEGIAYERFAFSTLFNLPGAKEGVTAFLTKRPPNFNKIWAEWIYLTLIELNQLHSLKWMLIKVTVASCKILVKKVTTLRNGRLKSVSSWHFLTSIQ